MAPKKSLAESYQLFFRNLFNFQGRTRRSDFWRVAIINSLVVGFVSGIFSAALGEQSMGASIISYLLSLALFVLELALVIRRLHDVGKEWTYYLLCLIPLVGWIIVFVALIKDSDPGDNQFGPNPKADPNAPVYQAPVAQAQPYQQPVQPAQPYAQPAQPVQPVYAPPQPAQDFNAAPAQPVAAPAPAPVAQPVAPVAAPVAEPAPAPAPEPVATAPAYCASCGSPVPLGSNNCPNCGAPVK